MDDIDFDERWGTIAKRCDKIGEVADKLNWNELIDQAADAFNEASQENSSEELFFIWYQYFFRLYFRVKDMTEPQPFDQIYEDHRVIKNEDIPMFRVSNYSWKTFRWVKKFHPDALDTMTNGWFLIRKDKLKPSELNSFEKRIKKD